MKRICIYVTYDFENIIDDYIGYMLNELRKVVDNLVVVCNYKSVVSGMKNIQAYADKIYYRTNKGFDAGAYKDALCHYLGWDIVYQYDELLLINDSFYGPIYPFEEMFSTVKNEDIDYWGITRSPQGELANGYKYDSHIQSYFLCFRKRLMESDIFRKFWEKMIYPITLEQAIITYEIGINRYLDMNGFIGTAVTDIVPLKLQLEENENPYMLCPLELIRDSRIPILKRKCLRLENTRFDNALQAFQFIDDNSNYDIQYITKHLLRLERKVNDMGLNEFYETHSSIYIYGAGLYGKNLARYFEYRGWTYKNFLVTNTEDQSENCISLDEANITENDGIIIAVGIEEVFWDIMDIVKKCCKGNQIYNWNSIL